LLSDKEFELVELSTQSSLFLHGGVVSIALGLLLLWGAPLSWALIIVGGYSFFHGIFYDYYSVEPLRKSIKEMRANLEDQTEVKTCSKDA